MTAKTMACPAAFPVRSFTLWLNAPHSPWEAMSTMQLQILRLVDRAGSRLEGLLETSSQARHRFHGVHSGGTGGAPHCPHSPHLSHLPRCSHVGLGTG